MFCKNCGAQVKDSDLFCEKCGARLQPPSDQPQTVKMTYEPESYSTEQSEKKHSHKAVYIVLGSIMGVLLLAVVLEMLYLNKLNKETEDYTAPEVVSSTEASADGTKEEEAENEPVQDDEKIEITTTPVPTETPVPTLQTTVSPTQAQQDYIFADSSSRYLTESEIRQLTPERMSYARNEIYARHGRKFRDAALQAYFDAKPWYHPQYEPDAFDAIQNTLFNDYEKENVKLISKIEQEITNGN